MVDNAVDGVGIYGGKRKRFPGYSKNYFKHGSPVDLTLSGEMLDSIQVLDATGDEIVIGFEPGTSANAKADGNIRGAYGGSPNPKKARPFLGVTADELNDVLAAYERRKDGK